MLKRRLFTVVLAGAALLALTGAAWPVQAGSAPSSQAPVRDFIATPLDHGVTNIVLFPPSPSTVEAGDPVTFNLTVNTTEAGGVLVFARPYSGGAPTPGATVTGSALVAAPGGGAAGSFTVPSGEVVVDHILFEITNADESQVLQSFKLPVHYHFSDADNLVHNIVMSPPDPNIIRASDQILRLDFAYKTSNPEPVHIVASPLSAGQPVPGFTPDPSPSYATGTGTGTTEISIPAGDVRVDTVRFDITNVDEDILLDRIELPVTFAFAEGAVNVSRLLFSLHSPNVYKTSTDVSFTFDYASNLPSVRVIVTPLSLGTPVPGATFVSDPLGMSAAGTGNGSINITEDLTVNAVRVQVTNPEQTTLLWEEILPVHYQFGRGSNPIYMPFVSR